VEDLAARRGVGRGPGDDRLGCRRAVDGDDHRKLILTRHDVT